MNALTLGWFSLRGHPRAIFRAKLDALRGMPTRRRGAPSGAGKSPDDASEIRRAMARGVSGYVSAWRLARDA